MLEIVGDSHVIAMADAHRQAAGQPFASRHGEIRIGQLGHGYHFLEPFFAINGSSVRFTQNAARSIFQKMNPGLAHMIEVDDARRFVFVFGFYPSFGFNEEHWGKHTSAVWANDRHFVTESAFRAIVDHTVRYPLAFFETLSLMNVRFSVASCCPIPAGYRKAARKTVFAEHEIALIYNRFRDQVTEKLNDLGVFYHHPPSEVYDEYGAMRDEFARTPTDYHANVKYGELMLSKILKDLEQFH